MATLCKNCGHALVFDPTIQKVRCEQCGSTFLAEEVESESKKYAKDQKVLTMEEVYGADAEGAAANGAASGAEKEFLDCYIYTCSECGGEITIHGSEVSTKCIYCGNPTVVFSRISQEECPQYIIPFAITKEQALEAIKEEIRHGFFVPKEVRNFTPDSVHGIYIPYWLVDAESSGSYLLKKKVSSGKYSSYEYYGRSGILSLRQLPVDACTMLSPESSTRLEPFDMTKMKAFDEDYLLGFYSNASDLTYADLDSLVSRRAKIIFDDLIFQDFQRNANTKIEESCASTRIDPNIRYAMLPAWFVTFDYKGQHNTILVNGQTGKVVCGLPMRKALFYTLLILSCVVLTVIFTFLAYHIFHLLFGISSSSRHSSSNNNGGRLIALIVMAGVGMIAAGVKKIKNVSTNLKLTQSSKTFNFTKKRQE
ncbi:MAG: hypothetical protein J5636_01130 [Clostridiales bacterium]|nr:hypothetical protein [Clostridiales bacterium]